MEQQSSRTEILISALLLIALAVVIGRRYLPTSTAPALPSELRALADEIDTAMPGSTQDADAGVLHGLMHGLAVVLVNDGKSDAYYVPDLGTFKDRMLVMGELVVGPGWSIKDRYPGLPAVIEKHLAPVGAFPEGRAEAARRLAELADCFEAVACD